MTPRTRYPAMPATSTPRHARGRARAAGGSVPGRCAVRGAAVAGPARAGSRAAAAVAAVAFTGGIAAGAVVQPLGADPGGASASVVGQAVAGGAAAGRSTTRGDLPAAPGLDAAVADVRPIPVPELVERDATGPLWLTPADREAGLLALDVPRAASGVLDAVPGTAPAPAAVGVRTVRVEVERGLPVDGAAFAATVMATLNDPRGWGARGDVSFARTDGPAELRVVLASPDLVDALCAPLETVGEVSCGRNGHAVLNHRRWVLATDEFPDRTQYRQYLVNHEVGHLLGHGHEECPAPGRLAPLMQQQSLGVAPCVPNGWPFP